MSHNRRITAQNGIRTGKFVPLWLKNDYRSGNEFEAPIRLDIGLFDIPIEKEMLSMMDEIHKNPKEFRFVA